MSCLYCGKAISSIRKLRDADFCSVSHRRLHAERLSKVLTTLCAPEPPPASIAGFVLAIPPCPGLVPPAGTVPAQYPNSGALSLPPLLAVVTPVLGHAFGRIPACVAAPPVAPQGNIWIEPPLISGRLRTPETALLLPLARAAQIPFGPVPALPAEDAAGPKPPVRAALVSGAAPVRESRPFPPARGSRVVPEAAPIPCMPLPAPPASGSMSCGGAVWMESAQFLAEEPPLKSVSRTELPLFGAIRAMPWPAGGAQTARQGAAPAPVRAAVPVRFPVTPALTGESLPRSEAAAQPRPASFAAVFAPARPGPAPKVPIVPAGPAEAPPVILTVFPGLADGSRRLRRSGFVPVQFVVREAACRPGRAAAVPAGATEVRLSGALRADYPEVACGSKRLPACGFVPVRHAAREAAFRPRVAAMPESLRQPEFGGLPGSVVAQVRAVTRPATVAACLAPPPVGGFRMSPHPLLGAGSLSLVLPAAVPETHFAGKPGAAGPLGPVADALMISAKARNRPVWAAAPDRVALPGVASPGVSGGTRPVQPSPAVAGPMHAAPAAAAPVAGRRTGSPEPVSSGTRPAPDVVRCTAPAIVMAAPDCEPLLRLSARERRSAPSRCTQWAAPQNTLHLPPFTMKAVERSLPALLKQAERPDAPVAISRVVIPGTRRERERAFRVRDLQAIAATFAVAVAIWALWSVLAGRRAEPVAANHAQDGRSAGVLAWVRQTIARRATVELGERFDAGTDMWSASAGKTAAWTFSAAGANGKSRVALYRPSLELVDYRLEFLTRIEKRGAGWVVRARDSKNYYGLDLRVVKAGPRPMLSLVRYAVVEGRESRRVEVPVAVRLSNDMPYRIAMAVSGRRFAASIEGQEVDAWADDAISSGGVGFLNEANARARVYWVKVTNNDDLLGRVCGRLAAAFSGGPDAAAAFYHRNDLPNPAWPGMQFFFAAAAAMETPGGERSGTDGLPGPGNRRG